MRGVAHRRDVRIGLLTATLGAFALGGVACKNKLTFGTGGGGSLACEASGAICPVGPTGVGDAGDQLAANLMGPTSLSIDGSGNLLVAEVWGNRIRKIDPQGKISTLAGTGAQSYGVPPGVPATSAPVPAPISVTSSPDGWVFWADADTCTIYGLSPTSGEVSFVAGDGGCGTYNPGPDQDPHGIRFSFFGCSHVRTDSLGNLIIPDSDSLVIRYFNRGSSDVTVWGTLVPAGRVKIIAGNGSTTPLGDGGPAVAAGFYYVCDAVPTGDGALLITDLGHHRVRRVDPAGNVTTIAGSGNQGNSGDGGPALAANFYNPYALATLGTSGVFVFDNNNNVRLVNYGLTPISFAALSVATSSVMTVAGPGNGSTDWMTGDGSSALQQVFQNDGESGVVDAAGDLLIADVGNGVLRKLDHATGTMSAVAGLGLGGTLSGYLNRPASVAVAPDGTIYAAANSPYVWKINATGAPTVVGGTGVPDASGDGNAATAAGVWASGVAVGADGTLYIADAMNQRVRHIDAAGIIGTLAGDGNFGQGGDGGPAISAELGGPTGVAIDSAGNLFVLCAFDESIRFVNRGSTNLTVAGVAVGAGDMAIIAGNNGGGWSGDGGPALAAQILPNDNNRGEIFSSSLALDNGVLYFADTGNNRIRAIDLKSGTIDTVVGAGSAGPLSVGMPTGVAVHGGYLYWTQAVGSYVRRMKLPYGSVETIAGDGGAGYAGDQGYAVSAELAFPGGLAFAPDGSILIADASHRIRRIHP